MIPLEQVSDFKRSLIQFTKVKAPVSFPETLDTSRYQFSLLSSYKVDGIYQLAEVDSSKILAIDRFSGDLFSFGLGDKTPDRKYLGNVFDSLGFLRNSSESIENYKIDKAGNRKSQNPKIFATAFDLDYAFNRVYLSITLPSDDQSCTSLQLYSFKLPTSNTNPIENVARVFQSPCVLDKKNQPCGVEELLTPSHTCICLLEINDTIPVVSQKLTFCPYRRLTTLILFLARY